MSYTYIDEAPGARPRKRQGIRLYQNVGKRVLDIVTVALILPVALPVILLAWLAMFVGSGSGFYSQQRIGKNGQVFKCWKIRTMARDADELLAAFIQSDPQIAREWSASQKLQNDPRITTFGNFLRKTSIDELPQLWNVLIGEMSLIGPRPFTPNQKRSYDGQRGSSAYYLMRPGISGLWQVESRNSGVFTDRVGFDQTYVENLSFIFDLKIVIRTVLVVLQATGK